MWSPIDMLAALERLQIATDLLAKYVAGKLLTQPTAMIRTMLRITVSFLKKEGSECNG